MQNKVSYVVIIILAFVCLVLSLSIGRASDVSVQKNVSSLEPVPEQEAQPFGGVAVSSEETKNFLADEYVTSFTLVLKHKNKDAAYKHLNESRDKILTLLKKRSVDSRAYEFSSAAVKDDWKYTNHKKIFLGYVASQNVKVISHSKQDADSLELDLAGLAFVDNVSTSSRLKNAEALEVSVIKEACKKASKLADVHARSVGAEAGKVLSVEGSSMVEKLSSSDSVEVLASIAANLSLVGVENGGKSYVRVSQSENKKFLADKFVVVVGMSMNGADKEMIYKRVSERRNDVVQLAKDLGVAESEIDEESMHLFKRPDYEFDSNESRKDAFRAAQKITVNFTAKAAAEAFLDGMVGMENSRVLAARPVLKNEDSLRVQVTNIAGKKAMSRAKAIAEGFGGSLGKVVSVSNKPENEFGRTGLGSLNGALLRKARGKSAPMVLPDADFPKPGMNIADSVSVSAYLAVTAEIE